MLSMIDSACRPSRPPPKGASRSDEYRPPPVSAHHAHRRSAPTAGGYVHQPRSQYAENPRERYEDHQGYDVTSDQVRRSVRLDKYMDH
eukprot:1192826-Prorocentrum_minimum.AAC.1